MADRTQGKSIDYHLGFESARALFSDLTPARIDLLDTLRRMGPSSSNSKFGHCAVTWPATEVRAKV